MTNKTMLLMTALALSACDGEEAPTPDFIGSHGERVTVSPYFIYVEEYETIKNHTFKQWATALAAEGVQCDWFEDNFWSMTVKFVPRPYKEPTDGQWYNGMFHFKQRQILIGHIQPLKNSSIGHELGHYVLWICGLPFGHRDCLTEDSQCEDPSELTDSLADWINKYPYLPY